MARTLRRCRGGTSGARPQVLTLGFARRFTAYKRPHLLLRDPDRLTRILTHPERPVQLIVAGKAHPQDGEGKRLVQQFVQFASRSAVRQRVVFLADYDMALGEHLVQGVDVWLNTPRRPWEACGTSGMKVLVNGGLNCSELDGWWAEAYSPDVGWALGDGQEHPEASWDAVEAAQLYVLLERHIIPEFYDRDPQGIPVPWIGRMGAAMAQLTPRFSSNRMMRDYVEQLYLPATARFRRRTACGALAGDDSEGEGTDVHHQTRSDDQSMGDHRHRPRHAAARLPAGERAARLRTP